MSPAERGHRLRDVRCRRSGSTRSPAVLLPARGREHHPGSEAPRREKAPRFTSSSAPGRSAVSLVPSSSRHSPRASRSAPRSLWHKVTASRAKTLPLGALTFEHVDDPQSAFEFQDARPDGGRRSPPKPTAHVLEFGTAAFVETSQVHVLQLSGAPAWVEVQVLDTRGRPVPHFHGVLQASDGEHPLELDESATSRAAPLPDALAVSVRLRAAPASPP